MVFPGKNVVGKRFLFEKDLSPEFYKEVDLEADIMLKMPPHDNVLKGFDYLKKETTKFIQVWLIMEYCTLGSLDNYAKTKKILSLSQKVHIILQSLAGLKHIHSQKIIHRDIKPANVLITGNEDTPTIKTLWLLACHASSITWESTLWGRWVLLSEQRSIMLQNCSVVASQNTMPAWMFIPWGSLLWHCWMLKKEHRWGQYSVRLSQAFRF